MGEQFTYTYITSKLDISRNNSILVSNRGQMTAQFSAIIYVKTEIVACL